MRGIGNDLVREARKRARLTQAELARRAGVAESEIIKIEAGEASPSFDLVLRPVRLCGLDLEVMLVERDGSDWLQAQRLARYTPQELHEHPKVLVYRIERQREQVKAGRSHHRWLRGGVAGIVADLDQDATDEVIDGVAVRVASLADIIRSSRRRTGRRTSGCCRRCGSCWPHGMKPDLAVPGLP